MKLLNINVGIKINNTHEVGRYIKEQDADFVAIQEVVRHLEDTVYEEFRSKAGVEEMLGNLYPYNFFGPLWVTDAFRKEGKIHRDFGGHIEQGNQFLSKFEIVDGTNEHYYKTYSYAKDWTNWRQEDHGRAVLITEFDVDGKRLQVLNLHGIWTHDKRGDERTIAECEYVVKAAKRKDIPTIITGDFNLLPETGSIQILNKEFTNLISEYGITSTRPHFDDGTDKGNQVVDYIFVNDGIKVNNFEVPETDVSDHLPLILDFEIK
jgi:endonuclease/exonuclease/phosphatase family metal-dependent hydrolase